MHFSKDNYPNCVPSSVKFILMQLSGYEFIKHSTGNKIEYDGVSPTLLMYSEKLIPRTYTTSQWKMMVVNELDQIMINMNGYLPGMKIHLEVIDIHGKIHARYPLTITAAIGSIPVIVVTDEGYAITLPVIDDLSFGTE